MKETVTIDKEQYESLVAYFNETTLDILKLNKKIGRVNTKNLCDFTSEHCTDETNIK